MALPTLYLTLVPGCPFGKASASIKDHLSRTPLIQGIVLLGIMYSPLTLPTLKVNVSTTNGNAYPVNGTIVSLHCDAGGQNVVNYTFYKDGVTACSQPHVTCDKDFLYFQPIMMSDTGRYTCKIENPVSSNSSQPLSLTVIEPVLGVALSSNASSGLLCPGKDSVRLTCSALGTNVTFSWHLDGAPLPTNPRYHLMNSNSSLIISPVERTDNGSFTCTASNSLNNQTSSPLTLNLRCKYYGMLMTNENIEVSFLSVDYIEVPGSNLSLVSRLRRGGEGSAAVPQQLVGHRIKIVDI
eukprot:XP_017951212.1 PREDICTED: carcinoembryonic antigen-related cell adhesion molecule 5-like [Xenopus tropicalis]